MAFHGEADFHFDIDSQMHAMLSDGPSSHAESTRPPSHSDSVALELQEEDVLWPIHSVAGKAHNQRLEDAALKRISDAGTAGPSTPRKRPFLAESVSYGPLELGGVARCTVKRKPDRLALGKRAGGSEGPEIQGFQESGTTGAAGSWQLVLKTEPELQVQGGAAASDQESVGQELEVDEEKQPRERARSFVPQRRQAVSSRRNSAYDGELDLSGLGLLPVDMCKELAALEKVQSLPASVEDLQEGSLDEVGDDLMMCIRKRGKGGRNPASDARLDPSIDPKKAHRIMANRLSAARSKLRQRLVQQGQRVKMDMLESQKSKLLDELSWLRRTCREMEEANQKISTVWKKEHALVRDPLSQPHETAWPSSSGSPPGPADDPLAGPLQKVDQPRSASSQAAALQRSPFSLAPCAGALPLSSLPIATFVPPLHMACSLPLDLALPSSGADCLLGQQLPGIRSPFTLGGGGPSGSPAANSHIAAPQGLLPLRGEALATSGPAPAVNVLCRAASAASGLPRSRLHSSAPSPPLNVMLPPGLNPGFSMLGQGLRSSDPGCLFLSGS